MRGLKQAQETLGQIKLAVALRRSIAAGYKSQTFMADLMAGIIVGMIAIPLGMSLAISTGLPPQFGLYTIIVAGALTAFLGGSNCQVTGPTAAFIVVLVPIVQQYGLAGLLTAGLMAGFILIAMGMLRMGKLIEFIPHPVITGFTSGIALVIFAIQLKDFFGISFTAQPAHFHERVSLLFQNAHTFSLKETFVATVTLIGLIYLPKVSRKIPAPLIVLPFMTIATFVMAQIDPDLAVATIKSRFSFLVDGESVFGIPSGLPEFNLPWEWSAQGLGQGLTISFATIKELIGPAFTIAFLAAIESLLAAMVADSMANTKHDPDAELTALGIASVVGPFFGGIPATGALARTATNIKFGARSPIAAITHALFVLMALLFAAPIISLMPMASLSALLIIVAYNMSELHRFKMIIRVASRGDILVLLTCFSLTVVFDMVIGVGVGMVLASFVLVKRMTQVTKGYEIEVASQSELSKIFSEYVLYEITGLLFFAASDNVVDLIHDKVVGKRGVVFLMDKVSAIDVSAVISLEGAMKKLIAEGKEVLIVGVGGKVRNILSRSELLKGNKVRIFSGISEASSHLRR